MQDSGYGRRRLAREDGIALVMTLLVLMLVSVMMAGFIAAIVSDQRSTGSDRDQTQAYGAAQAGLEKLTSDLAGLFNSDVSPTATQVNALAAAPPTLPGFSFLAPDNSSGYTIAFTPDASGNPAPADVNGTTIAAGPYQGFKGIITAYDITVTARSIGGAEVRMRRTLQSVAIPVFQFGVFSETDLSFHAGETFGFGGRVHTNGNLFLAEADGAVLTLSDRVTAVKEVIRTELPNGLSTNSGYNGTVKVLKAPNSFRDLARTEGSFVPGSGLNEPTWTNVSKGAYSSNIMNGRTGARRLDLPLVSQGAVPIDLIRRPPPNENTANPTVYQQRFYAQASLRILLSDQSATLQGLPTTTATPATFLGANLSYTTPMNAQLTPPLALSGGTGAGTNGLPKFSYLSSAGEPLINGWITIEMQRQNGTWQDVTSEILGLGIAGRNLADTSISNPTQRWDSDGSACPEASPNAVIRLQRMRPVPVSNGPCGTTVNSSGTVTAVSQTATDYWPNSLYDPREGQVRDGLGGSDLALGGVMQYIELDVANLKRWLLGQIGSSGPNARNDNGFIVYFSDRRNNQSTATPGSETGEYGWEDVVNPATSAGTTYGGLDIGEDLNGSGDLQAYGRIARNVPNGATAPMSGVEPSTYVLTGGNTNGASRATVARANRTLFFRRALKIVHGGLGSIIAPGLTVASENPVYLQGDYNATSSSTTANPHVAAAIVADAVTLLSNNWNDVNSFTSPSDSNNRRATSTGYRVAIIAGKGIAFPKPGFADGSFGSDGGVHNFLRNLEDWDSGNATQRYRGSLVSFFINRQAVGTFKCCQSDVYIRGERDWAFDTDFLTPALLPPGTPMFRDVNTLTFRQMLRPNQ